MKKILDDINKGTIKKCYLFYGEEAYLKKQYAKKLRDAVVPENDTMNETVFRENKIDVKELLSICSTMPFFAERRFVYVVDSGFFEKAPEELLKGLQEIPDTTCLLFSETKVDKRGKLYKFINKSGYAAEFTLPDANTLKQWVLSKIKKEGKKITRQDLEHLMSLLPEDMNRINLELEKLFCYTLDKEILTTREIDAILCRQLENQIFEMISSISAGKEKKAIERYYELLELKEAPLKILALLVREFRILYDTKTASMQGVPSKEIASKLHMNPYIIKKYVQSCTGFELRKLGAALKKCADTEERIKTGKITDTLGVEVLIVQLLNIGK